MHIAFFDSGLGGLSVALEVFSHPQAQQLNIERCTYIADTDAFPYGNKPASGLTARISAVLGELLNNTATTPPDLIVLACNTASTLALSALREQFKVPFVGVVPAIKPAALLSDSKAIGVLATPETVKRDYTAQLISNYAPNCEVVLHGSALLVHQAEQKLLGHPVDEAILAEELHQILKQAPPIDTIVLACTHFPLLLEELSLLAPHIHWVDSGEAIARRVVQLRESKLLKDKALSTHRTFQSNRTFRSNRTFQCITTGGGTEKRYQKHLNFDQPLFGTLKQAFEHFSFTNITLPGP